MARDRKPTKAEEADILRRKGNRYATGASDKALESEGGVSNVMRERKDPKSKVFSPANTMRRIAEVRKPGAKPLDDKNQRKETLEALRAVGELSDKEYAKRKKGLK